MPIFHPTAAVTGVLEITPELLSKIGVSAVILDVDNTLSLHGSQTPYEGTVEWSRKIRDAGIAVLILSNNTKERVEPFAALYGIPFVSRGLKPLPFGYWRCAKLMEAPCGKTAVVGDQIFTDTLGANNAGVIPLLVEPIRLAGNPGRYLRYAAETPFRMLGRRRPFL